MNLSGLFQYGNKNTGGRRTETVKSSSQTSSAASASQSAARNLRQGQTLQGEVIAKNGNEIQIRVNKDTVITARLEKDVNISVGQNMTFEVRSSDSQIALRPLYENLVQDANAMKALEAANLPQTDELMRMVSAMMKQGMSIDKNALQEMSRLIQVNPGVNPETIVALRNMQLPVTPENIEQFERYQNYEHQILNSVKDILTEMPETFQMMLQGGQTEQAVSMYSQILQIFTGDISQTAASQTAEQGLVTVFTDMKEGLESAAANKGEPAIKEMSFTRETEKAEDILQNVKAGQTEEILPGVHSGEKMEESPSRNLLLSGNLEESGRNELARLLGKLGFSEEQLQQVKTGDVTVSHVLEHIHNILERGGEAVSKENVISLFGSKVYQQLLNSEVLQQWLMEPAAVAKKEGVKAFYDRLKEQTSRLTEALQQAAKDTPLAKGIASMRGNLDFMNQVNQVFNYVQLPLKMSGGDAHGDLYVYTNRKGSLKEDGSVSALLHLDMEHLGAVDIYVTMKAHNVGTKFYLQDESMIDFIAANIHILNERLTKRGYTMTAEMQVKEDSSPSVIENIKREEHKTELMAQYAFDVRA